MSESDQVNVTPDQEEGMDQNETETAPEEIAGVADANTSPTEAEMEDAPGLDSVPTPHPLAGTGEDITSNKDGGVLKAIVKESEETEGPMNGDHVEVHYVGTLLDGTKFDSSRDRGERFSFTLGEGQVIKAWDIGIATMKIGEVCVLTCKPEYAYGKKAHRNIPDNSTLVFEVELFVFEGQDLTSDKDKGILKRILESGDGEDTPNMESLVEVHLTGSYEGNTFEDRDVKFVIGEGDEQGIVDGVEQALQKMKGGEKADLTLSPKYAFGCDGKSEFNIPGRATVKYQVHLKSFEKAKEAWQMDLDEKLDISDAVKAKGTEHFKSGRYVSAVKQYKKIDDYLSSEKSTAMDDEKRTKCDKLLLAAYLNLAMCYLKMGEDVQAVDSCDKALEIDNKSEKGYFRRGSARLCQSEFELAAADFRKVLELGPNNKAAKNQLMLVHQKIKAANDRDKKIYGNMFAKFAEQDAKVEAKRKAEQAKKQKAEPVPDETENVSDEEPPAQDGTEEEVSEKKTEQTV